MTCLDDEGMKEISNLMDYYLENARILIANTSMDTDKIKIYGSRVRVDAMSKVAEIEEAEKDKMR